MIYLDYQSTTPLAPEVLEAMLPWMTAEGSANPHAAHVAGREAKAAVELAREQICALLPAGGHLYFTSGATEALNMALKGVAARRFAFGATEHAAVIDTCEWLDASGRSVTVIPVDGGGILETESIKDADVAAVMLVNNEIGTINDVAACATTAHNKGALLICDAVQGFGRVPIPDNCDLIAISGHKIHGPKGIGALWVRHGLTIEPLLHGGGQEGGLRSGTLSPALCAGFGVAASLAQQHFKRDAAHVETLWAVASKKLAQWQINGSQTSRYRGNLSIRRDGLDAGRLISELRHIAISAGSACASGSGRPSHVLKAIGLNNAEARSSIRIGFGRYTTATELCDALDCINEAADHQQMMAA